MAKSELEIKAVSDAIAEQGASWQAGETSMTALTDQQRKRRLGFVPPPGEPTLEELDALLRSGISRRPSPLLPTAAMPVGNMLQGGGHMPRLETASGKKTGMAPAE